MEIVRTTGRVVDQKLTLSLYSRLQIFHGGRDGREVASSVFHVEVVDRIVRTQSGMSDHDKAVFEKIAGAH